MLINAGVVRIVYEGPYPDTLARDLLAEAGVGLVRWPNARERDE
jgi:dCMP deaminase